ncbi:hypothetical protein PHAVU_011G075800 [Phaseolus vulgaris]|uniref:Uncharacterized protein n=1 Tax=Phaseolus vulgaris TaxID=3885 RepID=V7AH92_PHAVU|nr:hypothetical protein PHAVU_011G075800g [Phaseolus vulgaris]ESW04208.1 hypothetical protein PHAVU_011G075800g [Phaseolus vulgaris]
MQSQVLGLHKRLCWRFELWSKRRRLEVCAEGQSVGLDFRSYGKVLTSRSFAQVLEGLVIPVIRPCPRGS